MDHYFSENPNVAHNIKNIELKIDNKKLTITTDAGVFSKDKVDYGSELMIKTLPNLSGNILDLGCGYGVIGISVAVKNPDTQVTMVDINQRAIDLTKDNIIKNNLHNATAQTSDGFSNVNGMFSAIISNPPIRAGKKVIYPLFEQSINYLVPGGSLYLVIQKKQGANSAVDKLLSVFGNCEVINKQGGYWILKSLKNE